MEKLESLRSGQPCPQCECKGHLVTYASVNMRSKTVRIRYLRCSTWPECRQGGKESVGIDDLGRAITTRSNSGVG